MRMPGIDAQPLTPACEAIRAAVASLPKHERRSLVIS